METKKYTSYAEIEIELKILKLEKELHFQKMLWSGQKIKESFEPKKVMGNLLEASKSLLSNSYSMILSAAIPLAIKWLSKIKRGD